MTTEVPSDCSPPARRLAARRSDTAAYAPTTTTKRAQPSHTGMVLLLIARILLSRIGMVPPTPMILSRTPCRARNAASVTTKDGMPSRATSRPMSVPITAPVARPTRMDSHDGQPHRDDHHRGGLVDQVGHVERVGEGLRPQDREDDHQHDDAEHGRQRADVAAADP